jgi:hypothetical protein
MDQILELIERFLVSLGLALNQLSAEEKTMVTLLLAFLIVGAAAARGLQMAHLWH